MAKLGPTLASKITRQGQKAFKMTPKSKNLKVRKNLTKEKLSLCKSKASKTFQTHLNSKHSTMEPKKAQNDPQKQK